MRNAFLAIISSAGFLTACGLAADALADANLNCDAYAGAAVAQNQQNIAAGCGLTGGAWSNNFNAHRNWCLAAGTKMQNLTAEDSARKAALAQCANKPKLDQQACQTYANKALIAAKAAADHKCGFAGGRWTTDYSAHFNSCLGASQTARDQEDSARANQLEGCLAAQASAAEQAKKDACAKYAASAVSQLKENAGRQCKFTGERWSGDFFVHLKWCEAAGAQNASKETAVRADALQNNCMLKVCTTTTSLFSSTVSCKFVQKPWK